MSNRVSRKALQAVAMAGLVAGAAALSGCSGLAGLAAPADRTVTGSTSRTASQTNAMQPMPSALVPSTTRVAAGPYIPPSDIGGAGGSIPAVGSMPGGQAPGSSIQTQDLPVLNSSTPRNLDQMSAQPSAVQVAAKPTTLGNTAPSASLDAAPSATVASMPSNAYIHVIESGESLYTIARRYDVTAQAIVQANGLGSPDKIFVGQRLVIPGRADLLASKGPARAQGETPIAEPTRVASADPSVGTPLPGNQSASAAAEVPVQQQAAKPQPLQQPAVEPTLSGAEKFRWPVSGRVLTDFANSKGTGINIEAPEGAAIRAAENGQVIYVGNGVEGYGNLILVRHPNGYVSAYAHLKDTRVNKGDVVNRGDQIGTAGMTGSVSRPQLHFELRKGATPVDPVPLLAS